MKQLFTTGLLLLLAPLAMSDVILCTGMSNAKQECSDWIRNNTTGHEIINAGAAGWHMGRIHERNREYWKIVMDEVAASGWAPEDIDIIWNKNATRVKSRTSEAADVSRERQKLRDLLIEFQVEAEERFPNLKAGYHSPRSSGEFCRLNPEPFAGDTVNAIAGVGTSSGAITHFSKWSLGPDISKPTYTEFDFTDGCHPSSSGLRKITPILNAFFANGTTSPPQAEITTPEVSYVGDGVFVAHWMGVGARLSCGRTTFPVQGESQLIRIPEDLPAGTRHRCSVDQGKLSNIFGCRSGSCRVW